MKIIIEAEPKEIADLVREIQDRPVNKFIPEDSNGVCTAMENCEPTRI